jgi:putative glutamine amidotransferase
MLGSMVVRKRHRLLRRGPSRPRIGVPWRTSQEEAEDARPKIDNYLNAVRLAGGEPVLFSLKDPVGLERLLPTLHAFILPGSPNDTAPWLYGATDRGHCADPDSHRERTDWAILDHAFSQKKPILGICYGCQLINVYLGGTLIQDAQSELGTDIAHRKKDIFPPPEDDPPHDAIFQPGSRLSRLAGGPHAVINSAHHQSIGVPGRNLRVIALAPDGIVEAVEWTGDSNWIMGVQWHPERMFANGAGSSGGALDPFALKLFQDFVAAARGVAVSKG